MNDPIHGPYEYPTTACAPNPTWHRAGVTILPGGTALQSMPQRELSEADIERIADRVVAKLREAKP